MFSVHRRRLSQRGFTLTELMIVVALVGTLATIGVASFRGQLAASKTTEAAATIQAIRAAEEAYRAENQRYLNVSSSDSAWFPGAVAATRLKWNTSKGPDNDLWQRLGVNVNQPVMFRYLVRAGAPGTAFPTLPYENNLGTATDPWYLIQARADADGDGVVCDVIATSMNSELFVHNSGE